MITVLFIGKWNSGVCFSAQMLLVVHIKCGLFHQCLDNSFRIESL